jgi:predicted GIY-YIG superfamily endonuclease/Mor family transcriptional regulator
MAKTRPGAINHVYLITAKESGMQYVGVTCNFYMRMEAHKKADSLVGKAIQADTPMSQRIVYSVRSRTEAYRVEKYMIKKLNTIYPFGYNGNTGGGGGLPGSLGCSLGIHAGSLVWSYMRGATIKELAKRHNCSTQSITSRLSKSKHYVAKAGRVWNKTNDAHLIYKDRMDGLYITELMKKYGLCRDTIYRRIKEYEHRDIVEAGGAT